MGKLRFRKAAAVLILPLSVLFFIISGSHSSVTEFLYAEKIYPHLSLAVSRLTGIAGFSVAEIIIYLFFFLVALFLIRLIMRTAKAEGRRLRTLLSALLKAFAGAGVIYLLFITMWALNYHREELSDIEGLHPSDTVTGPEIMSCFKKIVRRANILSAELNEDRAGHADRDMRNRIIGMVERAYSTQTALPLPQGYADPKPFFFSSMLSEMGIGGFFFPFTAEANFNTQLPRVSMPFAIAHEMAHQRGFAREFEANFIAYSVCSQSDSPHLRYSAAFSALLYLISAEAETDPSGLAVMKEELGSRVLDDIRERNRFWMKRRGAVSSAFDRVNDAFLKANMQKGGTHSYSRFVNMLAAADRAGKL